MKLVKSKIQKKEWLQIIRKNLEKNDTEWKMKYYRT